MHAVLPSSAQGPAEHILPKFCARTSGNQRAKLCIRTAAISVLPRPVGRQTRVLVSSAVCSSERAAHTQRP